MKRISFVILILVMVVSSLVACSNPVVSEYKKFVNVYMVDINENYEKILREASALSGGDETVWISTLENVLIPLCDETLEKINEIQLKTDEVNSLKDKFNSVIRLYKEGFELLLDGVKNASEEKLNQGNAKLEEGVKMLEEYNKRLEIIGNFAKTRSN